MNPLLIIIISLTTNLFSQVQFASHNITFNAPNSEEMYAEDIDGDGDLDVLIALFITNEVSWYENDGNENFTTHIISTDVVKAISVFAGDLDGDTDIDVLSASALDSEINWYENLSIVGVESTSNELPTKFSLEQNFPNPFNPSTTINFSIPETSFVTLKIFNSLGEEIESLASEELGAGNYKYDWNANNLPSGIYFHKIHSNEFTHNRKMILIK